MKQRYKFKRGEIVKAKKYHLSFGAVVLICDTTYVVSDRFRSEVGWAYLRIIGSDKRVHELTQNLFCKI